MKSKKVAVILLFILLPVTTSFALPRFALLLGDKCSSCHVNPTGGELRNENGFFFGNNVLSMISPREDKFSFSPKITDNLTLGLDYRSQILYSQEKKKADFQDMTGSIYLNASVSEKINVYGRYDFVNALWEAYGVARILPNDSYIKVGSFIPYYGIRLDDHTSYTRGGDFGLLFTTGAIQGLIYSPLYIETGVEVGANFSDHAFLTASYGKSKFNSTFTTDPTFTARFEVTPSIEKLRFLLGGSFASTKTRNLGGFLSTKLYGGFAGVGYDRFTLMGEYDNANDYVSLGTTSSAMMIQATYQLMVGLQAVARYDAFDPNINVKNDEHAHLVLGFEFYPYSFVEVRPQYRINIETPKTDNNAFVLQFHFWY